MLCAGGRPIQWLGDVCLVFGVLSPSLFSLVTPSCEAGCVDHALEGVNRFWEMGLALQIEIQVVRACCVFVYVCFCGFPHVVIDIYALLHNIFQTLMHPTQTQLCTVMCHRLLSYPNAATVKRGLKPPIPFNQECSCRERRRPGDPESAMLSAPRPGPGPILIHRQP